MPDVLKVALMLLGAFWILEVLGFGILLFLYDRSLWRYARRSNVPQEGTAGSVVHLDVRSVD